MKAEFGQTAGKNHKSSSVFSFILHPSSFILLFLLLVPSFALAAPILVVEKPTFDFGEVESGSKVKTSFEIRNDGAADLVIEGVSATCDCTEAYAEPKTLAPNATGFIFATLDTSYRAGDLDKTVLVKTNDPARPEVTLHIKGKTYLPITVNPNPLFMNDLQPGKPAVADVTVTNTGKRPITVKKIWKDEGGRMKDEGNTNELQISISGKDDAPVTLPHKLEVGEYLWIRLTLTANPGEKKSVVRHLSIEADPASITPLVLKILADFRKDEGRRMKDE